MYNFQNPGQDHMLDDISEISLESSNMDDSRVGYNKVFNNPFKNDDSQLRGDKSLNNVPTGDNFLGNMHYTQQNAYLPEIKPATKENVPSHSTITPGTKESELMFGSYTKSTYNYSTAQNNDFVFNNPLAYNAQPSVGYQSVTDSRPPAFSNNYGMSGGFSNQYNFQPKKDQDLLLHDMSADGQSVRESNIKPVMNNPFNVNQSMSASRLDASNKSAFVELGQKGKENPFVQINPNQGIQNQNLQARLVNISGDMSHMTDDTKDLSHLSMNNFKNAFYQKDNSYYLNMTRMNDPNQANKSLIQNKSPESQNYNKPAYEFSNPTYQPYQSTNQQGINSTGSEYRYTGDFGNNKPINYGGQATDLLTLVNSNNDLRNLKAFATPSQQPSSQYYGFQQDKEKFSIANPSVGFQNQFNSVQTIPKNSNATEIRPTETKEIQKILDGLDSLDLSKISSIPEDFIDGDEGGEGTKTSPNNKGHGKQSSSPYGTNEKPSQQPQKQQFNHFDGGIPQSYTPAQNHDNFLSGSPGYSSQNPYLSNLGAQSPGNNAGGYNFSHTMADPSRNDYLSGHLNMQMISQNHQTKTAPNYPMPNFTNYSIGNQPNNARPMHNSQVGGSPDYHNPFAERIEPNKIQLHSMNNLKNSNVSNSPFPGQSPQQFGKTSQYSGESSPSRAAEEADQIVNKMQNLYKDWREKNAELNHYLNELSQNGSQGSERFSLGNNKDVMQNYSLDNLSKDQRPRQTMQVFSNHKNFYLNDKYTSPFEFRYSMQNPNSYNCLQTEASMANYRESYQKFMKEELLQGIEQPDPKKIGQIKQKFKTFSNPIFKKSGAAGPNQDSTGSREGNSLTKLDAQRDSSKQANKIFDSSKNNTSSGREDPYYAQNSLSQNNSYRSSQGYEITGQRKNIFPEAKTQSNPIFNNPEFKFKFKKQERAKPRTARYAEDEDLNLTIRDEGKTRIRLPTGKYQGGSDVFNHTLLGFNVKKQKLIQGVDQRRISTDNMEIICINCQEFIKMSDVDRHSLICDRTEQHKQEKSEMAPQAQVEELNNKLLSIRDKLRSKIGTMQLRGALDSKVKEILRIADNIINENNYLDKLTHLIKTIERLMEEISKSNLSEQELVILIIVNRIAIISKEKHSEMQTAGLDESDILALEKRIQDYEKEMKKQKAELEMWKYQAQMMAEIKLSDEKNLRYVKPQYKKDNEVLSQIQSDIEYSEKESSHGGTSSVTSGALPLQFDPGVGRSPSETAKNETKKIKFYSLAVNTKLLLSSSHPGKDVLISDLYDECLSKNIPEDKWESFIKQKVGVRE